jgi:hypothetical protein
VGVRTPEGVGRALTLRGRGIEKVLVGATACCESGVGVKLCWHLTCVCMSLITQDHMGYHQFNHHYILCAKDHAGLSLELLLLQGHVK